MKLLDDVILDQLERRVLADDHLADILSTMVERNESMVEERRTRLRSLTKKLREVERSIERLYEAIENGVAELDDTLRGRIADHRAHREELLRIIGETKRRTASSSALITPDKVRLFADAVRKRLHGTDSKLRKALLRLLVDRIEVDDHEVRISGSKSALANGVARGIFPEIRPVPSFDRQWWARQGASFPMIPNT